MSEKTLKTRIIHKHDTEANWLKATGFIPKQGELIVYDVDDTHTYERFKIGDGKTLVSELPFADTTYSEATTTTAGLMSAADKEKLDGLESGGTLAIEVEELPTENIDDSKIYVLQQIENAELYYFGGINYHTLAEVVLDVVGVNPTVNYYVVNELPTSGEITDLQTFSVINCYIFNDVAYVYGNADSGETWIPVKTVFAQMGNETEDRGRVYDLTDTSVEEGLYVYYEELPKKFYVYSNEQWEAVSNGDSSGLTQEEVQTMIDAAINGALGGNY